jgi:16S rRNA (cytosine967-C5)-methyltransferase
LTPRAAAARTLTVILRDGLTLDETLPRYRDRLGSARDRAFVQELCYGVLRSYYRLGFFANALLERTPRKKDSEMLAVLLCGLYEMSRMRTPDHAAVSESVRTIRELGKPRAAPLLNAVLRRFQREHDPITKRAEAEPSARWMHPRWLLDALLKDWPEHWEQIVQAGNERPALHLRVNRRRTTVDRYLQMLADAGLEGEPLAETESGIRLPRPVEIGRVPGFAEGIISVQDAGAQLAARILDVHPGDRVLDACAAPGGKSCHILEREPQLDELVAADRDPERIAMLEDNLKRLGLTARTVCADTSTVGWYEGSSFNRILLDVPCSATGVIRRHPDIKLLRKPGQISRYQATQDALLSANWPLLLRGGRMLYATCSLLREENDRRIENFTDNNKDVRVLEIGGADGIATNVGWQTIPGYADTDGFYYALLEKT